MMSAAPRSEVEVVEGDGVDDIDDDIVCCSTQRQTHVHTQRTRARALMAPRR